MSIAHRDLAHGRPIRRSEIVERAESWLRPSVPYSQSKFHQNEYGIYRTDCSGYVSMAWGLPGVPLNRHGGLDTIGLARISSLITKDELVAGDVLLRTEGTNLTRHVTIFHEWATSQRTAYWGFEQSGETGTVLRRIPFPYERCGELYTPHRHSLITPSGLTAATRKEI
ncbi:NlpC/P60 family protein [Actinokineospora xionganensis]|uniref:C40 family peptidase n=1 Tax=Actinokineospora xionganensis TaxID=2684470 RepID=A0ABR7L2Q7_9PSEU|nr:NlpC/P60 family protein [Actinokineospora xionganensis]MBC6446862.1 C40 family peptidase [Actinokineospora xionganensis]